MTKLLHVWRLENSDGSGLGHYNSTGGYPITSAGKHGLPVPQDDKGELKEWAEEHLNSCGSYHYGRPFPWHCGFKDFRQLFDWFEEKSLDKGCSARVLVVYAVEREFVKIGDKQVMFFKPEAEAIARIPLDGTPIRSNYGHLEVLYNEEGE